MNTLYVVVEANPEFTNLYQIQLNEQDTQRALKCHCQFSGFVGCTHEEDVNWLLQQLDDKGTLLIDGTDNKTTPPPPVMKQNAILILTGYAL